MKNTPIRGAAKHSLRSGILRVPQYAWTIDATGQAERLRGRARRIIVWSVVFGLLCGLALAGWGL